MAAVEKNIDVFSAPGTKKPAIVALDAMGGDKAPENVIHGASLAAVEKPDINYRIYGNKDVVPQLIKKYPNLKDKHIFIHADDVIKDDDKPSNALRKGKNSSMYMAINSVKNGESNAIVSSGNTGALMALAKLQLRTLPSIDRPAIGGILPTEKGYCVMLDLGANIYCEAENLFEFAIMGNAFARAVLGVSFPSIGLLNVGSEKNKGNEAVKSALALLQESGVDLNLYGFIEGDDIAKGTTDVVVADGFSGNIALKTAEGISKLYNNILKKELKRDPLGMMGGLLSTPAFKRVKAKMDPRVYNGAMLLGLNGIVIKSHGSTDEIGFANAIRVAAKLVENSINEQITREMISSGHIINGAEEEAEIDVVIDG